MTPSANVTPLPPAISEYSQQRYEVLATTTTAVAATCRYAGKKCENPRAVKRNGSLHNLCHYHRVRANQNQRRMELRRRIKRSREDHGVDAMLPAYLAVPPSGGFTAALLHTELAAPPSASWPYYDALPLAADVNASVNMNPPLLLPATLSPHDHLSDLFSAPPRDHYVVDMLLSAPVLHKSFDGPMLPHQPLLPAAFPMDDFHCAAPEKLRLASYSPFDTSAALPHECRDVVWCDQGLVLL